MSVAMLPDDLETYVGQYGTHGAIQRLLFIAGAGTSPELKLEALKFCIDRLKRTTNTKGYFEAYSLLKEVAEAADQQIPQFDNVWCEATAKQASILKDVYEQDLHQAKVTQVKEAIRSCHMQLASFYTEQGDYAAALKDATRCREYCSEPGAVFATCMTVIKLSALLGQYHHIHNFASKAQHSPLSKDDGEESRAYAAYGLYYMTAKQYKEAARNFAQVKLQDAFAEKFSDVVAAQDVALYGALCALASMDRKEVQTKILGEPNFRECLDTVPQIREVAMDFCGCRYAQCFAALEKLRVSLQLDVHLNGHVDDLLQAIRQRGIVQYFAPFLSVSLRDMATAFNTDVDGMQQEVAQLVGKKQLDAKIDSHKKVLHVRHANQRTAAYQNTLRVTQGLLDSTQALVLRMNLLKHDFGVHLARQKKASHLASDM